MKELKDWKDITVAQFYKIKDIIEGPQDDYMTLNLLDIIYDIDSSNMPISELNKYNGALEFINTEIPLVKLEEKYEINGIIYMTGYNLSKISAAQFIDYNNYTGTNKYEDYLSVVFIPEGHQYNDGYDIEQVKKDLLNLPITVVRSLVFFYTLQCTKLQNSFLSYLKKDLRKMKMEKEKRKEIEELIDKLEKTNLELFQ